jgi:hypothetical protein
MKQINKLSLVATILSLSIFQAQAGGTPDNGHTPPPTNSNGQGQGQDQAMSQGQAQGQIGINKSSNANTNVAGAASQSGALSGSVSGSSANQTGINKSDNSLSNTNGLSQSGVNKLNNDNSSNAITSGNQTGVSTNMGSTTNVGGDSTRINIVPSLAVPAQAATLVSAQQMVTISECGPLQSIIRKDINGVVIGYTGETTLKQGENFELDFYRDPKSNNIEYYHKLALMDQEFKQIGWQVFGHQVVQQSAVIGTSANRQAMIGAGNNSGWGQGGMASSSSMQQAVTRVTLRVCELPRIMFAEKSPIIKQVDILPLTEPKKKVIQSCGAVKQPKKKKRKCVLA